MSSALSDIDIDAAFVWLVQCRPSNRAAAKVIDRDDLHSKGPEDDQAIDTKCIEYVMWHIKHFSSQDM